MRESEETDGLLSKSSRSLMRLRVLGLSSLRDLNSGFLALCIDFSNLI
jgi:hypothetical protein